VIVVNDGSTGPELEAYKKLEASYPEATFCYLVHRQNGHGSSYVMNYGVSKAGGQYVAFLDDDDSWTDTEHLARARRSLEGAGQADVYYTNQWAYYPDGNRKKEPIWLESLGGMLEESSSDPEGTHTVDADFLLKSMSFAHFNCSIFKKSFFEEIGGLDENIRYENDRELFIRALDKAGKMLFNPLVVSRHNIPDHKLKSNVSTAIDNRQKRLYQLCVFEKGVMFSEKPAVNAYCVRGKGDQLKHLAVEFSNNGDLRRALYYARQALAVLPSLKWRVYTAVLAIRGLWH
jgi:glycosyltransferase involved in cell wall biosynthesis